MKIFINALLLALLVLATKADDVCDGENNNFFSCLANLDDQGTACSACYVSAFPTELPGSCQEGEDQFCPAFDTCKDSCGDCVDEVFALLDCLADDTFGNCNIDCSAAPVGHLVMPLFSVVGAMVTLSFI